MVKYITLFVSYIYFSIIPCSCTCISNSVFTWGCIDFVAFTAYGNNIISCSCVDGITIPCSSYNIISRACCYSITCRIAEVNYRVSACTLICYRIIFTVNRLVIIDINCVSILVFYCNRVFSSAFNGLFMCVIVISNFIIPFAFDITFSVSYIYYTICPVVWVVA